MSNATLNAGGAGGKERKPPSCPHCKDPLKNHPKPLCSQLIGEGVEMGIKEEWGPLLIANTQTGASATASLPVGEDVAVTATPRSVSEWRAGSHELLKPEEDEDEGLQALSLHPAENMETKPARDTSAEVLDAKSRSIAVTNATAQVGIAGRRGKGLLTRILYGAYWVGFTIFRATLYLAEKCLQLLAIAIAVAMLMDMVMELREQGRESYHYPPLFGTFRREQPDRSGSQANHALVCAC
ncbi:hypothetical protein BKA70DRAFT_1238320 [Coprinopsis sp. MPI-PUGE-AT-0042]|nr:hypothetical protein BKA70DRAFT_1238320 [Coprinopsis sp. MPI-PUGE-AT-0042]